MRPATLFQEVGWRVFAALQAENGYGRDRLLGSPHRTIVTRAKRAQSMHFVEGWSQPNERNTWCEDHQAQENSDDHALARALEDAHRYGKV